MSKMIDETQENASAEHELAMIVNDREKRWRLILGRDAMEHEESDQQAAAIEATIEKALTSVYGTSGEGGMDDAAPEVARWLEDIRTYFPKSVVKMMQEDALGQLNLRRLLRNPEVLRAIEPDVHLIAKLVSLSRLMPIKTRETARQVVKEVLDELLAKLRVQMEEALAGNLNRAVRTNRPRYREINWNRTIRSNLKHFQPKYNTIVPEQLIGYGRKRTSMNDVILCVDQSGSMSASVVYSSLFSAVLASLPSLETTLVAFSTSVVDLTEELNDPVDLLFGTQLRGGTDIERAVAYCQQKIKRPEDTIFVLITDLFDGKGREGVVQRMQAIQAQGVTPIVLLTLSDEGAPRYNVDVAKELSTFGIPCFACTPDQFPELMATALNRGDIHMWLANQN